jgi:hypothetical protein
MRHRGRRFVLALGAAIAAALMTLAACSDNAFIPIPLGDPYGEEAGPTSRPTDAGKRPTDDGATSPSGDDDDSLDASNADCSAAPVLHSSANGFYCPFLPTGTGSSCKNEETCCNPGKGPSGFPASFCASTPLDTKGATGTACANQAAAKGSTWVAAGGSSWECGDHTNCADGQVCCLFTDPAVAGTDKVNVGPEKGVPAACLAMQLNKYGGTYCAASCNPDNEIQTCGSDADCTAPQTCKPFIVPPSKRDLGYCN